MGYDPRVGTVTDTRSDTRHTGLRCTQAHTTMPYRHRLSHTRTQVPTHTPDVTHTDTRSDAAEKHLKTAHQHTPRHTGNTSAHTHRPTQVHTQPQTQHRYTHP